MSTVFVTGANGFIAQHLVQQLLDKKYKVVGTVRTEAKGQALKNNLNNDNFSYEIVPTLEQQGIFDDILKRHPEAVGFFHTASPFRFDVKDPEADILAPAIDGTRNLLSSIKTNAPQITKLVLTSSDAAARIDLFAPETTIDESTWSPATYESSKGNAVDAYLGSKPLAEKLAWDFVKNEKPNFTLTTVLPSYTFGPQTFDSSAKSLSTSSGIFEELITLKPDSEIFNHTGSWIDARDVARAHVVAYENNDAVGHRLVLSSSRFALQSILDIIVAKYPQLKGKIYEGTPGQDVEDLSKLTKVDYSQTEKILGFKYRTLEETIVDAIDQLYRVNTY